MDLFNPHLCELSNHFSFYKEYLEYKNKAEVLNV